MDKNCASCAGCSGNCQGCSGCGSSLELTREELQVLEILAQTPFLPVARRADQMEPICLEPELSNLEDAKLALMLLEKKGLIDLDYRMPLKGFEYAAYSGYPCQGSMALTARGQQVLDLAAVEGVQE